MTATRHLITPFLVCTGITVEFLAIALLKVPVAQAMTEVTSHPTPADLVIQEPESSHPVSPPAILAQAASPTPIPTVSPVVESVPTPAVSPAPQVTPTSVGIRLLSPTPDTILDVPATIVVLQFAEGQQAELSVNGVTVPRSQIGRTETDTTRHLVTQTWYGVALQEGTNTIAAKLVGSTASQSVMVQVRGNAKSLTLQSIETRIPADGRSTATIKGTLLDEQGNRSNRDAIVTLVSNAGEFVGADANPDQPGFQIKAIQGEFTAILKSGLTAQTVTVQAKTNSLEAFTKLQFETDLRPSIATGVIDIRLGKRGTNFHDRFRNFLPADGKYNYQIEARGAVFATGRIGSWLFTGAYNSEHPLNQTCDNSNPLFREQQACDTAYPVYGDSSQSSVLTPSTDNWYLKLERTSPVPGADPDYFMWGDYKTEEFARKSQEFTAFTRQLHGFKGNYNLGNLQITGLYANNVQGFQRDTIAPDGTSGYYFLSRRPIQEGSEDIFLELEELNRPGTVLSRKKVNRGEDYEIDYDRGTVIFRRPVLRTAIGDNGETLVQRIIATYQYDTQGDGGYLLGGRVQYHFSREQNRESWIGATYLRQFQGAQQFELYGADAYISLGSSGRLIAEYAHSTHWSDTLGKISGSAYRIEVAGKIGQNIDGRAFYRHVDSGFANDATYSFTPGQTRYGAQITAKVSPTTNLRFQFDHERNQGTAPGPVADVITSDGFERTATTHSGNRVDNSLTTISAGLEQKFGQADFSLDWLHRTRTDRINDTFNTTSDQLRTRFSMPLTKTLTLLAQNETTLSRQKDPIYSDRTLIGLNWAVMPGVNVQVAQQFYGQGGIYEGKSLTSVNVSGDYKLGPNTTLRGRLGLLGGANELLTRGAIGLEHQIRLSPGLRIDLSYEQVFGNFAKKTAAGDQYFQPFALGQTASTVGLYPGSNYSIGIEYIDSPAFQASARYEHRTSRDGSNTVITAGATGKLSPALTAMLRFRQASSANQKLTGLGDTTELKLGLAYRDPNSDKFNALLRYEYRKNPSTIPETLLIGSGTGSKEHLFAVEAIYAPSWRWEFYGKFALRSSKTYLADDYVGKSTIWLGQVRATYRLSQRWDLAAEARWINQSDAGYRETGMMVEAGYYLTPNLRLSAGYSFGRVNDRDFTGTSRSAGGPYLGVTVKLNELWGGFGAQKIAPPQQQESEKKVVTEVVQPNTLGVATEAVLPSLGFTAPAEPSSAPIVEVVPPAPGSVPTSADLLKL